jgi:2-iminoacetate synthase ThiH
MKYRLLENEERKVLLEPLNSEELISPIYKTCVSSCGHCRFCADSRGPITLKVDMIRKITRNYLEK